MVLKKGYHKSGIRDKLPPIKGDPVQTFGYKPEIQNWNPAVVEKLFVKPCNTSGRYQRACPINGAYPANGPFAEWRAQCRSFKGNHFNHSFFINPNCFKQSMNSLNIDWYTLYTIQADV